jgi:magnesium transporter
MLRIYSQEDGRLVPTGSGTDNAAAEKTVWFDLINPTPEEDRFVEDRVRLSIPTREEMEEIELSSRLYSEDGGEFMTVTALVSADDDPAKTPVTFILKGDHLVTVRYAEPTFFALFAARAQKENTTSCATGERVMLGLLESMVARLADVLERISNETDTISREVFRRKASVKRKTRNLEVVIEQLGRKGDLLAMTREALVSVTRLLSYHHAVEGSAGRQGLKSLQRDVAALGDHAAFLSNKVSFLLDATLGLINLQQNQIIKIFSVAAVIFLPPTLVASIYGMNFEHMPELEWLLGYPWALGLMALSAALPFLYFKRRGWL